MTRRDRPAGFEYQTVCVCKWYWYWYGMSGIIVMVCLKSCLFLKQACPKFQWPITQAVVFMVGNMCQKSIFHKSKNFYQGRI